MLGALESSARDRTRWILVEGRRVGENPLGFGRVRTCREVNARKKCREVDARKKGREVDARNGYLGRKVSAGS